MNPPFKMIKFRLHILFNSFTSFYQTQTLSLQEAFDLHAKKMYLFTGSKRTNKCERGKSEMRDRERERITKLLNEEFLIYI